MGSSLTERAALYRRLAGTLSNADDVDTVLELAEQLDDLARLQFPMQVELINPRDDQQWLKQALNNAFKLQRVAPQSSKYYFRKYSSESLIRKRQTQILPKTRDHSLSRITLLRRGKDAAAPFPMPAVLTHLRHFQNRRFQPVPSCPRAA